MDSSRSSLSPEACPCFRPGQRTRRLNTEDLLASSIPSTYANSSSTASQSPYKKQKTSSEAEEHFQPEGSSSPQSLRCFPNSREYICTEAAREVIDAALKTYQNCGPGVYFVDNKRVASRVRDAQLANELRGLDNQTVERRTRRVPVTDACNPTYHNPWIKRDMSEVHHMVVAGEDGVAKGQFLGFYYGTQLTQHEDGRETAGDPTGTIGLKHSYTFDLDWLSTSSDEKEFIVLRGNSDECRMCAVNANDDWLDQMGEHCENCRRYRRPANTQLQHGFIVEGTRGTRCVTPFLAMMSTAEIAPGDEVLTTYGENFFPVAGANYLQWRYVRDLLDLLGSCREALPLLASALPPAVAGRLSAVVELLDEQADIQGELEGEEVQAPPVCKGGQKPRLLLLKAQLTELRDQVAAIVEEQAAACTAQQSSRALSPATPDSPQHGSEALSPSAACHEQHMDTGDALPDQLPPTHVVDMPAGTSAAAEAARQPASHTVPASCPHDAPCGHDRTAMLAVDAAELARQESELDATLSRTLSDLSSSSARTQQLEDQYSSSMVRAAFSRLQAWVDVQNTQLVVHGDGLSRARATACAPLHAQLGTAQQETATQPIRMPVEPAAQPPALLAGVDGELADTKRQLVEAKIQVAQYAAGQEAVRAELEAARKELEELRAKLQRDGQQPSGLSSQQGHQGAEQQQCMARFWAKEAQRLQASVVSKQADCEALKAKIAELRASLGADSAAESHPVLDGPGQEQEQRLGQQWESRAWELQRQELLLQAELHALRSVERELRVHVDGFVIDE